MPVIEFAWTEPEAVEWVDIVLEPRPVRAKTRTRVRTRVDSILKTPLLLSVRKDVSGANRMPTHYVVFGV